MSEPEVPVFPSESPTTEPPQPPARPAPREKGRIQAIDVARGFALLGIFLVNIDFFALPLGAVMEGGRPEGSFLDQACWWIVSTFGLGKFYPLFSLLFGIGLVLQRESIEAKGGRFVPIYLRRTLLLMAIGFVHGVFVWYGDILFIYSFAALVLLACSRLSVRWLFGISAALVVFSILFGGAVGSLGVVMSASGLPSAEVSAEVAAAETPAEEAADDEQPGPFREWLELAPQMQEGPGDPRWMELETRAYQEGGFGDVLGFRVISFVGMLASMLFGGGWHVLAMFFLGAALCRYGIFEESRAALRRRLLWLALLGGAPLALVASVLRLTGEWGVLAGTLINFVAGPPIALGYLLLWHALVEGGRARRLTGWLASTGRMALTNYLSQSILASAVMYYWGLGLFGTVGQFGRDTLVVSIFALQVAFSVFWMSRFRFGPLEWMWRSATYLRVQPLRRR